MNLSRNALSGVHCALVTPTDATGRVDRAAVRRLVDHVLASGASGLVPVGGTGEYPALAPRERVAMVEATVEAGAGRVPVVAGVLSPGISEATQAGRDFAAAGADGLLLITPYYTTPTQDGVRAWFEAYREAVDLPLLLYEIPSRTGVALGAETIAAMAESGVIVGMKACNTNLTQFIRVMALCGERIAVMSGEEPFFATHVAMGATGGILATCNLVPRLWNEIYGLAARGDLRGALGRQDALNPFLEAVFAEVNPGPLKAALRLAGLDCGPALLPLLPPRPETAARLEKLVPAVMEREGALAAADRLSAAD